MILDTLAEICNERGNPREAVALIEQAMEQQPESDYYPQQLARFQERLAEAGS